MVEDVEVRSVGPIAQSTVHDRYRWPPTVTELVLAEILAEVGGFGKVSVDSHFFDDLRADSLVMAHFCARIRKREDLPSVSMENINRNPTIRSLASALGSTVPAASAEPPLPVKDAQTWPVSVAGYVLRGAIQLLHFVGYAYLFGLIICSICDWPPAASNLVDIYLRSLLGAPQTRTQGVPVDVSSERCDADRTADHP